MGGRGPAPKDPEKHQRPSSASSQPTTYVSEDGKLRGPALPLNHVWPPQTQEWWSTWRVSAQSQTFTKTDWDFLLDTALLHAAVWTGNLGAATELRLRLAKFGATPEDRARLRLHVRSATDDAGGGSAPAGEQGTQAATGTEGGGRYGHLRPVPPPA